ncbi:N-acetylmannosamine-6-phosphate 2-epimerase [Alkalibacterium sp. AK22]|uniref:N-acetylmannosamine-6-phosphate 2-epimerase n=1 Tax=Alkalibacterium sp. AK22 TaxID=1229520 RepID=UPI0004485F49|nr:N-acetylmannosamine-6-phosphate 2-epimerase [Alkalibacterium sp. AK22]EXJ23730.1 N-acetylmannosamine-6-phosphate 2-epimerase [Alkalibacterium sp. AK22]
MLDKIKGGLVVSCQALEDEPLHSSFIMGKMAKAAEMGGAVGIRANSQEDILAIKKEVSLPIIGIVKRDYTNSSVYITPTMKEIDELMTAGCDMIALDATSQNRPSNQTLAEFVEAIREKYGKILLMADTATLDEAIKAEQLGFDVISTTLVGYTNYTRSRDIFQDDYRLMKQYLTHINVPVIAEGKIDSPEKMRVCLNLGAHAVVVGSAITRPQRITQAFTDFID